MIRFWTVLQNPMFRAVLIEDGKEVTGIPDHAPHTPARWVAQIGEYNGKLIMALVSSFQIWEKDASCCLWHSYHRLCFSVHSIVQYGEDLLVCASGHDLFFLMDAQGNVKWEWWGHKNGIGGYPKHLDDPNWEVHHNAGYDKAIVDGAHFNSIWLDPEQPGTFLTSALKKRKIIRIEIGKQGYEHVADAHEGVHSPVFYDGQLIYGTNKGLVVDGVRKLPEHLWVKYVARTPQGWVFTSETAVVFTDFDWKVTHEFPLPRPFQVAYLEMT